MSCAGSSDRNPNRATQHQFRKRSEVLSRPVRICPGFPIGTDLASPVGLRIAVWTHEGGWHHANLREGRTALSVFCSENFGGAPSNHERNSRKKETLFTQKRLVR